MADVYDAVEEEPMGKDHVDAGWITWLWTKVGRYAFCSPLWDPERVRRLTEKTYDQNIDELTEQMTRLRNKISHELSHHRIEKQRLETELERESRPQQAEKLVIQILHEEDVMNMYNDDDKQLIVLKNAVDKRVLVQKSSAGMLNVLDLEQKVSANTALTPYHKQLTKEREQENLDKVADSLAQSEYVLSAVARRVASLQHAEEREVEQNQSYASSLVADDYEMRVQSRLKEHQASLRTHAMFPAVPSDALPGLEPAFSRYKEHTDAAVV